MNFPDTCSHKPGTGWLFELYLPYHRLLAWSEALFTGMTITLFVAYKPEWFATFDDGRYLRNQKRFGLPSARSAGSFFHRWRDTFTVRIRMNPRKLRSAVVLLGAMLFTSVVTAADGEPAPVERHGLPKPGSDLVGGNRAVTVREEETLLDIAREQGIGQEEIVNANPGVDRWLPTPGSEVIIPGRRLLPAGARRGIVINLPEYRLYYFPEPAKKNDRREVVTVPISVGRMDWKTPLGLTKITGKQKNPSWTPPASIRAEHEADGDILPQVVPPGPDNPLGAYAFRLGIPGYLIHGTDKQFGVGMRVTHGCMRLLPEHVEALFELAPVGTPVRLMNQPIKLGWEPDALYLEVHPPLEEDDRPVEVQIAETFDEITLKLAARPDLALDEAAVKLAIIEKSGLPVPIARANRFENRY